MLTRLPGTAGGGDLEKRWAVVGFMPLLEAATLPGSVVTRMGQWQSPWRPSGNRGRGAVKDMFWASA